MTNRVQIPAYTDRWMMGDRYGEVVKTSIARKAGKRDPQARVVAHVKLDKSGKVIRVMADDCTPVDAFTFDQPKGN